MPADFSEADDPVEGLGTDVPAGPRRETIDTRAVAAALGCCVERVEGLALGGRLVAALTAELHVTREANRRLRGALWVNVAFGVGLLLVLSLPWGLRARQGAGPAALGWPAPWARLEATRPADQTATPSQPRGQAARPADGS